MLGINHEEACIEAAIAIGRRNGAGDEVQDIQSWVDIVLQKIRPFLRRSIIMFKAIGQLFTAAFTLFSAVEKGASSLNHLAGIADAESEGLADQMTVEREARLRDITKQLKAV